MIFLFFHKYFFLKRLFQFDLFCYKVYIKVTRSFRRFSVGTMRKIRGDTSMAKAEITEARQYLTFKLGDEVFALDVSQVREVLDLSTITKVPGAPPFMRGVINVRGSVVPVMDLKVKFGLTETTRSMDTRIIVMELNMDEEITVLSALADSVSEVKEMEPGKIEKPPKIGSRWRTEFIKGIGKEGEQFIIILDIDRVFSTNELILAEQKASDAAAEVKPSGEQDDASEQ